MKIVTIHQPEHLSYLGFFHKVRMADELVLLDNVKFEKNYFQNRNRIYTGNGEEYITVPVTNKNDIISRVLLSKEWEIQKKSLTGVLNGTIGILEGSDLYFHKNAVVSEDYWICGLNAYKHRKCWIDERFSVVGTNTFGNPGGCANYRTTEQEMEDTIFLKKMFGDSIKVKEDTKLAKRKHQYQRTLTIPF